MTTASHACRVFCELIRKRGGCTYLFTTKGQLALAVRLVLFATRMDSRSPNWGIFNTVIHVCPLTRCCRCHLIAKMDDINLTLVFKPRRRWPSYVIIFCCSLSAASLFLWEKKQDVEAFLSQELPLTSPLFDWNQNFLPNRITFDQLLRFPFFKTGSYTALYHAIHCNVTAHLVIEPQLIGQ